MKRYLTLIEWIGSFMLVATLAGIGVEGGELRVGAAWAVILCYGAFRGLMHHLRED